MRNSLRLLVLVAFATVCSFSNVYAQGVFEWTAGASSTDWGTAGNWNLVSGTDGDGIPDADDEVRLYGSLLPSHWPSLTTNRTVTRLRLDAGQININAQTLNFATNLDNTGNQNQSEAFNASVIHSSGGTIIVSGSGGGNNGARFLADQLTVNGNINFRQQSSNWRAIFLANYNGTSSYCTFNGNVTIDVEAYGSVRAYSGLSWMGDPNGGTVTFNGNLTINTIAGNTGGRVYLGDANNTYNGAGVLAADQVLTINHNGDDLFYINDFTQLSGTNAQTHSLTKGTNYASSNCRLMFYDVELFGHATVVDNGIGTASWNRTLRFAEGAATTFTLHGNATFTTNNDGNIALANASTATVTIDGTADFTGNGGEIILGDGNGAIVNIGGNTSITENDARIYFGSDPNVVVNCSGNLVAQGNTDRILIANAGSRVNVTGNVTLTGNGAQMDISNNPASQFDVGGNLNITLNANFLRFGDNGGYTTLASTTTLTATNNNTDANLLLYGLSQPAGGAPTHTITTPEDLEMRYDTLYGTTNIVYNGDMDASRESYGNVFNGDLNITFNKTWAGPGDSYAHPRWGTVAPDSVAGNFTFNNNSTMTGVGHARLIWGRNAAGGGIGGNVTINLNTNMGGFSFANQTGSTVDIYGNLTVTSATDNRGDHYWQDDDGINGNGPLDVITTIGAFQAAHWPNSRLTVHGDATFTNQSQTDAFCCSRSDFIIAARGLAEFKGNLNINRGLVAGEGEVRFADAGNAPHGSVLFSGTANQTITTTNQIADLRTVEVNKPSGKVLLAGLDVELTQSLNQTSGIVDVQSVDLILNDATLTGSWSDALHIQANGTGSLRRNIPNSSATLMPVGNGTTYRPVTITQSSGGALEYYAGAGSHALSNWVNGTYRMGPQTGSQTTTYIMQWPAADEDGSFDRTAHTINHYVSSWGTISPCLAATGANPYTTTITTDLNGTFAIGGIRSNAGNDITETACGFVTLAATDPGGSIIGAWSQQSGPTTAIFEDVNLANSKASNLTTGTYVFRWSLSGCGTDFDDVTVNFTAGGTPDATQTWNGSVNTDWANCANWTGLSGNPGVPSAATTVIIPNTANQPVLNASTQIASLTLQDGANLDLGSNTLTIDDFLATTNSAATKTINNGNLTLGSASTDAEYLDIRALNLGTMANPVVCTVYVERLARWQDNDFYGNQYWELNHVNGVTTGGHTYGEGNTFNNQAHFVLNSTGGGNPWNDGQISFGGNALNTTTFRGYTIFETTTAHNKEVRLAYEDNNGTTAIDGTYSIVFEDSVLFDLNQADGSFQLARNRAEIRFEGKTNVHVNEDCSDSFLSGEAWSTAYDASNPRRIGENHAVVLGPNAQLHVHVEGGSEVYLPYIVQEAGGSPTHTFSSTDDASDVSSLRFADNYADGFGNGYVELYGDVSFNTNNVCRLFLASYNNEQAIFHGDVTLTTNNTGWGIFVGDAGWGASPNGLVNFKGDVTINGGVNSRVFLPASEGQLYFTGTANQTITTDGPTTRSGDLGTVIIDKPSGSVVLGSNFACTDTLDLRSGNIVLGSYNLDLETAEIFNGGASSYIVAEGAGYVQRQQTNDATAFFYPVGNASSYTPATLTLTAAGPADNIRVTTTPSAETVNYIDQSWVITHANTGLNPVMNATFQWNASNHLPGMDPSDCGLLRRGATTWLNLSSALTATGSDPYSLTQTSINRYSPGTMGRFTVGTVVNAEAGPNQSLANCGYAILDAVDPAFSPSGYPVWRYKGAGTINFEDSTLYNSTISGLSVGVTKLYWYISATAFDSVEITITGPGPAADANQTWNGKISTDWNDCANWTGNLGNHGVPTAATNVTIPAGAPNYPILDANQQVLNFFLEPDATISLAGHTLTANGTGNFGGGGPITGTFVNANGGQITVVDNFQEFDRVNVNGNLTLNIDCHNYNDDFGGNIFENNLTINYTGNGEVSFGHNRVDTVRGNLTINSSGNNGSFSFANNATGSYVGGNTLLHTTNNGLIKVGFDLDAGQTVTFDGNVELRNEGGGGDWGAINLARGGTLTINGNTYIRNISDGTGYDEPEIRLAQQGGTVYFNGDVFVECTSPEVAGQMPRTFIGYTGTIGHVELASGHTISSYGAGITDGELYFRDFHQLGNTPQSLTTTGNSEIYLDSTHWQGSLTFNAGKIEIDNSLFEDTAYLVSNTSENWGNNGGNEFLSKATVVLTGEGIWDWGITRPDIFRDTAIAISGENITPNVPFNISPTTNYATNHPTSLTTSFSPVGDSAQAWKINQAQDAAQDTENEFPDLLTALNEAHAYADSALKYDGGCGVSMADITDSITAANNLLTLAQANYATALALVPDVDTNAEVNAVNAQTNYINSRINQLYAYINTTNTTSNTCNINVRSERLNTGLLRLAIDTRGNLFEGYTRFETNAKGRLQVGTSTTSGSEVVFSGDSLIIVSTSAGGTDGAMGIGFNDSASVIVNCPVHISNNADNLYGTYADASIVFGRRGILNLNHNVIVDYVGSTTNGEVFIGDPNNVNTALVALAAGRTISIGPAGFNNGTLGIGQLKQTTAEAHNFTMPGAGFLADYYTHWQGPLTVDAGEVEIGRSVHEADVDLTHRTVGNVSNCGGNRFKGNLALHSYATQENAWRWGSIGADTVDGETVVNIESHGVVELAYSTSFNRFEGKVTANINAGRLMLSTESNSNSTNPKVVFEDTVIINNDGPGMATGSGDWLRAGAIIGLFQAGTNEPATTNLSVFNRPLLVNNTSNSDSGDIFVGFRGAVHLNDSVIINNQMIGADQGLSIAFAADDWSGACQCSYVELADGYKISVPEFNRGTLVLRRFYQRGTNTPQEILLSTNAQFWLDSAVFESPVLLEGRGMELDRSHFMDTTHITCLEYGNSSSGGNVFYKPTTLDFRGIDNNSWTISGGLTGDKFLDKVNFYNSGTGTSFFNICESKYNSRFTKPVIVRNFGNDNTRIFIGHNSGGDSTYNAIFEDTLYLINNSNDYIRLGWSGSVYYGSDVRMEVTGGGDLDFYSGSNNNYDTLANGARLLIDRWTGNGSLDFSGFVQVGNTPQTLILPDTVGGGRQIEFNDSTFFNGRLTAQSSNFLIENSVFNGPTYITKTGNNIHNYMVGGCIYNDSAVFTNHSNFDLRLANVRGNDFNSAVVLDQNHPAYTGDIQFAYNGTTTIAGDVYITSDEGFYEFNSPFCCSNTSQVVFDGDSTTRISATLNPNTYLVFNRGGINKTHVSDSVILDNVTLNFDNDASLSTSFDFDRGLLFTGSNHVIYDQGFVSNNASDSSYILVNSSGTVYHPAAELTAQVLPVGNAHGYFPVRVRQTTGTDTMAVRLLDSVYVSYDALGQPNDTAYVEAFANASYIFEKEGANPRISLGWTAKGELPVFDRTQVVVLEYSAGDWGCQSTTLASGGVGTHYTPYVTPNSALVYAVVTINAQAGPDTAFCHQTTANLLGHPLPSGFGGLWTQTGGPSAASFDDNTNPTTAVNDLTNAGAYTFQWENTAFGGSCPAAQDLVTVNIVGNGGSGVAGQWTGLQNTDWFLCANWDNGYVPTSLTNVTIDGAASNPAIITPNQVAHTNNIIIEPGAELQLLGDSLVVAGDLTNEGTLVTGANSVLGLEQNITLNGTQNFNDTTTLAFNTTSLLAGYTANSNINYQKVRVNATSGSANITLYQSLTVTDSLTWGQGLLTTDGANMVVFDTTAAYSGYGNNSLVNGRVAKLFASTDKFTFPIGHPGRTAAAAITPQSTSQVRYEVIHHNQQDYVADSVVNTQGLENLNHASFVEYWDIDRTSGAVDAMVELHYDTNSVPSDDVTDLANLRVAHWNGTHWENISLAGTIHTGNVTSGSVATPGYVSSFSPFTLGSLTPNNPLPLQLLSFGAQVQQQNALLQWRTANERNVLGYQIERSPNGVVFDNIGWKHANNNANSTYRFADNKAFDNHSTQYYRLKMLDQNGAFNYSNIVALTADKATTVSLYPVPANNRLYVSVETNKPNQSAYVKIYNTNGVVVKTKDVTGGGLFNLEVNNLPAGLYTVVIQGYGTPIRKTITVVH